MGGFQVLNDILFQRHPLLIGLLVRLAIAATLPRWLDDGAGGVQYTDIDYYVFTDAAKLVVQGQSPFDRHTYRYTPFLAYYLSFFSPHIDIISRYLFCIADALCGYLILILRRQSRQRRDATLKVGSTERENGFQSESASLCDLIPSDSMWWLYNPLPINICTRGSAESLQVLLPVLLAIAVATIGVNDKRIQSDTWTNTRSSRRPSLLECSIPDMAGIVWKDALVRRACVCGCILGLAIHLKIYPLIYTLSFMAYFSRLEGAPCWKPEIHAPHFCCNYDWVHHHVRIWIMRLIRPASIALLLSTITTAATITLAAVLMFGTESWEIGVAYHLSRLDHRHNYSSYWYWIYLARAKAHASGLYNASAALGVFGKFLLVPQAILLFVSSLGIGPYNLELTLFLQTFLFVLQNKVITGQYFTWYLALVPLCFPGTTTTSTSPFIQAYDKRLLLSLLALGVSIVFWLLNAYCLEMLGMANHVPLCIASLAFYAANVNVFCQVLRNRTQQG
jgi:phosphatidylinositol glycan class M